MASQNQTPGVRKNIHVIVVMLLAVVMVVGFTLQAMFRSKPEKRVDKENPSQAMDTGMRPELERLKRELERQREEAERRAREMQKQLAGTAQETNRLYEDNAKVRAELERLKREREALEAARNKKRELARSSKLVALSPSFRLGDDSQQSSGMIYPDMPPHAPIEAMPSNNDQAVLNALAKLAEPSDVKSPAEEDRNVAWLKQQQGKSASVYPAPVRPTLQQGTVIPAVLLSGVNSDLPGMVSARITEDVYDSIDGNQLLIPKGSRVVGAYNTEVENGQDRILIAFQRLYLPDGRYVELAGSSGADTQGVAGLAADVDTHFWTMFKTSALISGLAFAADLGLVNALSGGNLVSISTGQGGQAGISSAGQILRDTAEKTTSRYENLSPTLRVPPGTPFNIVVNQDIIF